jgi:hypothetical protein
LAGAGLKPLNTHHFSKSSQLFFFAEIANALASFIFDQSSYLYDTTRAILPTSTF